MTTHLFLLESLCTQDLTLLFSLHLSLHSPEADSRLTTEPYTRSWDDDEHLGLHDMAVRSSRGMPSLPPSFPPLLSCSCSNSRLAVT